jgi:hypothetical protein
MLASRLDSKVLRKFVREIGAYFDRPSSAPMTENLIGK